MKRFKILISIVLSLVIGFATAQIHSTPTWVDAQGVGIDLGNLNPDAEFLGCAKGWRQFISSLIGYQGFTNYWAELVEFNICYRTDLEAVRTQVDKARRQVRSAFLRCDNKSLDRLTRAYFKLEVELYFLQNMIIKPDGDKPNEEGLVFDRITNEVQLRGFLSEMQSFFVLNNSFVTEDLMQDYFDEFVAKYSGRLEAYNNCRTDYYEEISERWNELMETFSSLSGSLEGNEKDKKKKEDAKKREDKKEKDGTSSNPRSGPVVKLEEDLDLNLKIARIKVEPEKSFKDLANEVTKEPGTVNKKLTFEAAPHAVRLEKERVGEELLRAELEARYDLLYAQISDGSVEDVKRVMDDIINTLESSIEPINDIEECVDEVEARQCKNK